MNRLDSMGAALCLVFLASCARTGGAAKEAPGCPVARVGDDVVTVADAEVLRAAIQPPLTRGEAKRLAVSATAAYRQQNPDGSLAAIEERLVAYRKAMHDKTELAALSVEPGACWAGPSPSR